MIHIFKRHALTMLALLTFAWLTLAPDPLPVDDSMMWFEGADKVVHALMLWGITCAVIFDYKRSAKPMPRALTKRRVCLIFVCMLMLSAVDETLQTLMGVGRTGDVCDLIADCIGIIVGLLTAPAIVNYLLRQWQKLK